MKKVIKRLDWLILAAILILALILRLYKIDNPIADWHSWRQADTAAVTRVFNEQGIDLLHPRFEDISSVPSGKDNPNGYRMVEFPLFNLLHLGVYRLDPKLGIDKAGRLTSVISSLLSIIFLFLIVKKLSGKLLAITAAFLMAVMPFSVFYSRVVLPEPLMIALLLISFYLFLQASRLTFWLSAVFLAAALLTKPYALFFTLPYLFWWWSHRKEKRFSLISMFAFVAVALAPLGVWRLWIKQFPAGIPASDWLYNNLGIRLRPAWFRWLFGERYGKLILGYWGLVPLGFGLLALSKLDGWIYRGLVIGVLAYLTVFAGGNVQHDYYQAITMPVVAIITAVGFLELVRPKSGLNRPMGVLLAGFSLFLMLFLSWYEIRGYYQINNPVIVEAGMAADRVLPRSARVIAPYNGDTAFLYQTNRFGWPVINTDLATMVANQKEVYFVSVNFDDQTNGIIKDPRHQVVERNNKWVIVKLFTSSPI